MDRSTAGITNWMHMFRWIVKLIRDEYGIPEDKLTRNAVIETDIGLNAEQLEEVLGVIAGAFEVRFPDGTLDELVRLEELCVLSSWLAGFYKQPPFLGAGYVTAAKAVNPRASAEAG